MIFSSFDSLVLSRYRDLFHVVCVVGRTWSSELGRVRDWSSHLPSLPRTSHRGGKATYSILRSQCVLLNNYFWAKINFSPLGIFIVLFSFFIGNNGSLRMWFNWLSNSSLSGLHSVSGCRRGGERNQGSYHHVGHSLKGRFCCREMINEFFFWLCLCVPKNQYRDQLLKYRQFQPPDILGLRIYIFRPFFTFCQQFSGPNWGILLGSWNRSWWIATLLRCQSSQVKQFAHSRYFLIGCFHE